VNPLQGFNEEPTTPLPFRNLERGEKLAELLKTKV